MLNTEELTTAEQTETDNKKTSQDLANQKCYYAKIFLKSIYFCLGLF